MMDRPAIEVTNEVVSYIARYGGRCRDCADEHGVCPTSGLPCEGYIKAIRHVLEALNYGVSKGFLVTHTAPDERIREEPFAWYTTDVYGCDYISRDKERMDLIAASTGKPVVPLYRALSTPPGVEEVEEAQVCMNIAAAIREIGEKAE